MKTFSFSAFDYNTRGINYVTIICMANPALNDEVFSQL